MRIVARVDFGEIDCFDMLSTDREVSGDHDNSDTT